MEAKIHIVDLIINSGVDIWNREELQTEYFEKGSIYLGAKEAIGQHLF